MAQIPFWYTVLALSEMEIDEAKAELKYAAPARRRQELAVRTLNRL